MTKTILAISAILVLNGCGETISTLNPFKPAIPIKPKCNYVKLPSYKLPESRKLTAKDIGNGMCSIPIKDLLELNNNNKKLRNICWKYDSVNKRVNKEYLDENSTRSRT